MKTLGICCGASTVTLVTLESDGGDAKVTSVESRAHEGNPKLAVSEMTARHDLASFDSIAATGRKFRHFLNMTSIPEPLATEAALKFVNAEKKRYNAIVSAGGETFMAYTLDDRGKICKVFTGNKCASGTGEFFLQQIRRMDVTIDQAVEFAKSQKPHHVSGRCSVFCKSDCTHATNKGVPKGEVVAGLCQMMAGKALELLKNVPKKDIVIVGGTTQNGVMMDYMRKEIDGLHIPAEATYFEALGAAVWALDAETGRVARDALFVEGATQFEYHEPLSKFEASVTFAPSDRGTAREGDLCVAGLDVGSTTTKIVLLRESDLKILASEYLRTNGDPVGASRKCYQAVVDQLKGTRVRVRGLGVTGSGRKIAGLHALTDGVINEIIAHATGAIHFDPEVDTIFEIGGQDAKYTYITNGVASDYAMNEACSAGTGSFLEESAKETLGIRMEDIADWAMRGARPPNFNDQCAAFISSDIKNAFHEGVPKEDIVAGLVYSICMNYVNRVKGSRPVGNKVFMQGGVCYNRAVPVAMAALSGKSIVVPPDPGLMGAFGVALEVKHRIDSGLMAEQEFDVSALARREVVYKTPFRCPGGKEKCDIGCEINMIEIEGQTYPFGGACNRYYNIRKKAEVDAGSHDLVRVRQRLVFEKHAADASKLPATAKRVGINRSFLTNTYYPLYSHFFGNLGIKPVLSQRVDQEGVDARSAPFCYPHEVAHGYFKSLTDEKPDFIFLPHVHGVEVKNGYHPAKVCPLVQAEPFILKSTFEDAIGKGTKVLTPLLKFPKGKEAVKEAFVGMAPELGVDRKLAESAFEKGWAAQEACRLDMLAHGKRALEELARDPARTGIVLFGRPYNAFSPETNKGIPHKFASRGYTLIPVDFLDLESIAPYDHMYWSMGQIILKGAEFILNKPQLFGVFITNFSCGPDSFIVSYFRDILGRKPSLTLELDNHTADAGLETRVEAFLDIVARYRQMEGAHEVEADDGYTPATSGFEGKDFYLVTSEGEKLSLYDKRVKMIFPSMSQWGSKAICAASRHAGVNVVAMPAMDEEDLRLGKGNTLCKECLPLLLTTGTMLKYLRDRKDPREATIFFMPTAEGPCRFGQYQIYIGNLIRRLKLKNVAIMSLTCDNNYAGLGDEFIILGWYGGLVSDVFQDIHNTMAANAVDFEDASARLLRLFDEEVIPGLEGGWNNLRKALKKTSAELRKIPMKRPLAEVPTVLVVGEVYVRQEGLSRRWLPEWLGRQGIAAHVAPITEWIYYTDWEVDHELNDQKLSFTDRLSNAAKRKVMQTTEKDVKSIMAESGWYVPRMIDIEHTTEAGAHYVSPNLTGEAILTVGGPLAEVGTEFCGAIAIGPFGCMPNRISESILTLKMDKEHILRIRKGEKIRKVMNEVGVLPFLAVESDGSPFPQVIEARLETFVLQAKRTDEVMRKHRD